jgi:hypothetical protein
VAIWAEIKKAINSNLDKPLNEFIDEILDTKIRNHLYRSDDYCVLGSSTTKTVLSTEKYVQGTGSSSNYRALLLGSFTIPEGVTEITVKAKLKVNNSSYNPIVYLYYSNSTSQQGYVKGDTGTSYVEYSATFSGDSCVPGKTIEFYLSTHSSHTYYCNSLKVVYKPYTRVVTSEKYLVGSEKTIINVNVTTNKETLLTQLPRLDRFDILFLYTGDSSYKPKTLVVDGVEYIYAVRGSIMGRVRY